VCILIGIFTEQISSVIAFFYISQDFHKRGEATSTEIKLLIFLSLNYNQWTGYFNHSEPFILQAIDPFSCLTNKKCIKVVKTRTSTQYLFLPSNIMKYELYIPCTKVDTIVNNAFIPLTISKHVNWSVLHNSFKILSVRWNSIVQRHGHNGALRMGTCANKYQYTALPQAAARNKNCQNISYEDW